MFSEKTPRIRRNKDTVTASVADRTFVNIPWDTTPEFYAMTASTAGFTVQVPGYYLVSGTAFFANLASLDGCILRILTTGEDPWLSAGAGPSVTGNSVILSGSTIVRMSAGDTCQFQVYGINNPASTWSLGSVSFDMNMSAIWVRKL
jgi:hypothetical protein